MRFCSAIAMAACLFAAADAMAGQDGVGMDLRELAEQGRSVQEAARRQATPDWLKGGEAAPEWIQQAAKEVAETSARNVAPTPAREATGRLIEVYVSTSLEHGELRRILSDAAGRPDVVVVFRGVPQRESLGKGLLALQGLVRGMNPVPNIVIDPPRYIARGVATVPAMVLTENGDVRATAFGLSDLTEFTGRAERRQGDLGQLGPTLEIAEHDMIEQMKERVAAMDFDAMKKRALERYWNAVPSQDLPVVKEYRKRVLGPTVVTSSAIRDEAGSVLIPAGNRINPLDVIPFHLRLVVFDARSAEQAAKAAELSNTHDAERVVLIASAIDREEGLDGYRRLQDGFRAPVYMLTDDLKKRFAIERVPTMVTAREGVFVIEELPVHGLK